MTPKFKVLLGAFGIVALAGIGFFLFRPQLSRAEVAEIFLHATLKGDAKTVPGFADAERPGRYEKLVLRTWEDFIASNDYFAEKLAATNR